jgi:hypothetical protein
MPFNKSPGARLRRKVTAFFPAKIRNFYESYLKGLHRPAVPNVPHRATYERDLLVSLAGHLSFGRLSDESGRMILRALDV